MENAIQAINAELENLENKKNRLNKIKEKIEQGDLSLFIKSLLINELRNPIPGAKDVFNDSTIKNLRLSIQEFIINGELSHSYQIDKIKMSIKSIKELLALYQIPLNFLDDDWYKRFLALEKYTFTRSDFYNIIQYHNPEELVDRLHQLIDGQKGKAVGSVLLKCLQDKLIRCKPSQKEVESEFAIKGAWSGIHKYMKEGDQTAEYYASKIKIF